MPHIVPLKRAAARPDGPDAPLSAEEQVRRWVNGAPPLDALHAPRVASIASGLSAVALLILLAAVLFLLLPPAFFIPTDSAFIVGFGVLGLWRYSWWGLQAMRALWYRRVVFPRLRARVDRTALPPASHVYGIVMSYKIEPTVLWAVYEALLRELVSYGRPATVIASVTHVSDVDLMERLAASLNLPPEIEVVVMFQDGSGKRSAMAEALRALARRDPPAGSLCLFMDGDCRITAGTLAKTLPFFALQPDLGGVTVDNRGITRGGPWTREWYELRFAQRNLLMCSLSLSRRLLVLTGRFSVIPAGLATRPDFIAQIERDEISHWRLGRIRFLSGDDKSTWYWLLRNGWRMLYVPDARVDSFEELPNNATLSVAGTALMRRWFGNMLRANGRALAIGPRRLGFFVWWSLLDQRISMWTSLVGPIGALMIAVQFGHDLAIAYLLWVLVTRTFLSLCLGLSRSRIAPHWPFLLVFNQLLGAAIKVHLLFRLDQQKWTRQKVWSKDGGGRDGAARTFGFGALLEATGLVAFLAALATYTGLATLPRDLPAFAGAQTEAGQPLPTRAWTERALRGLGPGRPLVLPAGVYNLDPTRLPERGYRLRGAGPDRTLIDLGDTDAVTCRNDRSRTVCRVGADHLQITAATVVSNGVAVTPARRPEPARAP